MSPSVSQEDVNLEKANQPRGVCFLELKELGTIVLEGFLSISPTLCVGKSKQVKMQGNVEVQGIPANAKEPVVGGPGLDHHSS